ncbi:MAG TPA: transcription elongation factor Spt5 [Nitrososphaera sp.]
MVDKMSDKTKESQEQGVGLEDMNFEDKDSEPIENDQTNDNQHTIKIPEKDGASLERDAKQASGKVGSPSASVQAIQQELPSSDSKFFAIRTTGGQERVVASLLQTRVNAKKLGIRSVMVLDSFKGYIIVEAPDSNVAYEALSGIRHVRGQIRGDLPFKDIEGYLVKKPVVSELNIDDTVEVIAGPFKAMKAKITRVDYEKQEATVVLLDSPYQIPVTVDANYLKKVPH